MSVVITCKVPNMFLNGHYDNVNMFNLFPQNTSILKTVHSALSAHWSKQYIPEAGVNQQN